MIKHIKIIYLDQFGPEFRQGYDASCVVQSIKDLLKAFYEEHLVKTVYINIHKDNLALCQGICAENLFFTEVKDPSGASASSKNEDEIWLLIKPSKMIK